MALRLPAWLRRPDVVSDVLSQTTSTQPLADRLRRELIDDETKLAQAARTLEAARQEERDAGLALAGREVSENSDTRRSSSPGAHVPAAEFSEARLSANGGQDEANSLAAKELDAARKRLEYATRGRELAALAHGIARARRDLHAGVLHRLEQEQAEDTVTAP